jgi:dolichol-phosphate mannosyltransferase
VKKLISIITACYNEEKNIIRGYERIDAVFSHLSEYDFELIFIDNASTDNSRAVFESLVARDSRVKVLIMSRNFGSNQPSILAGMRYAHGACVIIIDGDFQDPPELIPSFIEKWKEGNDVVYGVRKKRKGSIFRRIGYTCFYRLFRMLSYIDIPLDAGDTSLIDRKVVSVITSLPEKDVYIRGLRSWVGFKQTGIEYIRDDRTAGKTSNSFFANFSWAKKAIVNFSYKPLEFISRIAVMSMLGTGCAAVLYFYWHFKYGSPQGFSTIVLIMLFLGSVQLLVLSVIAEYLIRIFHEVKNRPPYIVSEILQKEKEK